MQTPAPQLRTPTWTRRGLLIPAPTEQAWAHSHAALPTVARSEGGGLDIYYSPRDEQGRAHIARARLEFAADGGLTVREHEPGPVLSPGPLGAFDDGGVTVSCAVECDEGTLLYYTGWTLGVSVPFYFYVGAALRERGRHDFRRVSPAPILERSAEDPYLTASPWVLREDGAWRMWYVSCTGWEQPGGASPRHYYHLRYAESADGVRWRRGGPPAVDFASRAEYAMSRPCVTCDERGYRMWFAARGESYRLAYAESADGLHWEREDARAGLERTVGEWDSEMEAYPIVFERHGTEYLLYNGNGYGRTGIGYATRPAGRTA